MTKLTANQSLGLVSDRDVSIIAGAGSGKTTVLIEKLFRIICGWHAHSAVAGEDGELDVSGLLKSVLCMTFTNKAALELRERLASRLEAEALSSVDSDFSAFLSSVRENIGEMTVSTMDSYFSSLLRDNAVALSISPAYSVCDPGSSKLLFDMAVRNVVTVLSSDAAASADRDMASFRPVFNELYSFFDTAASMSEALEALLSKRLFFQERSKRATDMAEDSEFLRERISVLDGICSRYVTASAFKNPSFARLAEIFSESGHQLGGKSAEKARQFVQSYERAVSVGNPAEFFGFLMTDFQRMSYDGLVKKGLADAGEINGLKDFLSSVKKGLKRYYKSGEVTVLSEFEFRFLKGLMRLFDMSFREYGRLKSVDDMLDFSDIEEMCRASLEVLESAGRKLKHVLIDEFQDTNRMQKNIVDGLICGPGGSLCAAGERKGAMLTVVGDGMQSIYRFRNAQSILFSEISDEIVSRGGVVVRMSENFRSSKTVIDFINGFFENYLFDAAVGGANSPDDNGATARPEINASDAGRVASPLCNEKPLPLEAAGSGFRELPAPVELAIFLKEARARGTDDQEESAPADSGAETETADTESDVPVADQYKFTAARIAGLVSGEGYEYGDIMVLMSRMTHVRELEEEMIARGIPYYIFKSRDFFERAEIFDILNLVRFLVTPGDDFSLTGLLRSPLFAVRDRTIFEIKTGGDSSARKKGLAKHSLYASLQSYCKNDFSISSFADDPVGREKILDISARLERYIGISRTLKPFELLSKVLDDLDVGSRYAGGFSGRIALANLKKLVDLLAADSYVEAGSLEEFLESLETLTQMGYQEEEAQDASGARGRVQIMTVHQSKGLQSKIVIVPEIEAKFFRKPALMVTDCADIAIKSPRYRGDGSGSLLDDYYESVSEYERLQSLFEKKRLLYVAMTRAKELIVMTGSARVSSSGAISKIPCVAMASSWLDWIADYLNLDAGKLRRLASAEEGASDSVISKGLSSCKIYSSVPAEWLKTPPPLPCEGQFVEERAKLPALRETPEPPSRKRLISYSQLRSFAPGESGEKEVSEKDPFSSALAEVMAGDGGAFPGPDVLGNSYHMAVSLYLSSHPEGDAAAVAGRIARSVAEKFAKNVSAREKIREMTLSVLKNFIEALASDAALRSFVMAGEGERRFTELPFEFEKEGFSLCGVCDLVIIGSDGNARIIDFKSGDHSQNAPLMQEYKRQLSFYSYCIVNGISGINKISGSAVVFLRPGVPPSQNIVVFPPLDDDDIERILVTCSKYREGQDGEMNKIIS